MALPPEASQVPAHPPHRAHHRCRLSPKCSCLGRGITGRPGLLCVWNLQTWNIEISGKQRRCKFSHWSWSFTGLSPAPPSCPPAKICSLELDRFTSGVSPLKPNRNKGEFCLHKHTSWGKHWQGFLLSSQGCGGNSSMESVSEWLRL